ncbi:MAG: hypothetical protein H6604_08800 [Flavobacteriales bacterium]|nr:hypothetical protein [Flavobacteriales bacterium]
MKKIHLSFLSVLFCLAFSFAQQNMIKRGTNPDPKTQEIPPMHKNCEKLKANFSALHGCLVREISKEFEENITVPKDQKEQHVQVQLSLSFDTKGKLSNYTITNDVAKEYEKEVKKAFKIVQKNLNKKIEPALGTNRKPINYNTNITLFFSKK